MLKRISKFFHQKSDEGKQDSEEALNKLLNTTKNNLLILKEREVKYGGDVPLALGNQIKDHQEAIAFIEQAIRGDLTTAELQQKLQTLNVPSASPDKQPGPEKDISALRRDVENSLKSLPQTIETLSEQVDSMPDGAKTAASELLSLVRQHSDDLTAEWEALSLRAELSEENLQALQTKIFNTRQSLSVLVQRRMHLRNLRLSQEQLAKQQMTLPEDVLHKTLDPAIHEQQEQIDLLEQKTELTSHEQQLLKVYQRNLELYQQMLTGQRLFAPLNILNQIEAQEQSIREIDNQLAGRSASS